MTTKNILTSLFLISVLFLSKNSFSQCGTKNNDAFFETLKNRNFISNRLEADTVVYVPIKIHIIRADNGTGGANLSDILKGIGFTDAYFTKAKVKFVVCGEIDYINSFAYDTISEKNEEALAKTRDVANVCNIYYSNIVKSGGTIYAGYAYFPGGPQRIIMSNSSASSKTVLAHEMGHFFGLPHTFNNSNAADVTKRELVSRGTTANCTTAGDFICDTPADPYVFGTSNGYFNDCKYNETKRDANGDLYAPLLDNMMSYYYGCPDMYFTLGQYDVITAQKSNVARTVLKCSQPVVAAPTNLSASLGKLGIVLNWKDNANNEMGYFVEMSSTATGTFEVVDQLPANSVTFTYHAIASNTQYFFRIRPVNAVKEVSNIASFSTGRTYCIPFHEKNCVVTKPSYYAINEVTIEGENILNNLTGCSADNYTSFSDKKVTVFQGSTYLLKVRIKLNDNGSYSGEPHVWLDLNDNAVFDNASEKLTVRREYSDYQYAIKIPANAAAGIRKLRIRVLQNSSIFTGRTDLACISAEYGSTEDYDLTIATKPTTFSTSLSASYINNYLVSLAWSSTLPSDTKCFLERSKTSDGLFEFVDSLKISDKKTVDNNIASGNYFYRIRRVDNNQLISNTATVSVTNYKKPFILKAIYNGNSVDLSWQGDTSLVKKVIVKETSYNYPGNYYGHDTIQSYKATFKDLSIYNYQEDKFYQLYDLEGNSVSNYDSIRITPYCVPRLKNGPCKLDIYNLTYTNKNNNTNSSRKYLYLDCYDTQKFSESVYATDTFSTGNTYIFSAASDFSCYFTTVTNTKPFNMAAWLDYNYDNKFAASELLYANKADNNPCIRSFELAIPASQVSGYARIRFIVSESSEFITGSCDSLNTAYASDFMVYLKGIKPTAIENENRNAENTFIYPNPSGNGSFTASSDVEVKKISVYDVTGNRVQETNETKVDNLKPGFYLVKIQLSNGKEWSSKLVSD